MQDIGHWLFDKDFDVNQWFGFLYKIVEIKSNKMYIGKKQLFSRTRKKIKGRKNRKVVIKESKWKTYTGSSTHLNDAIKKNGKDKYKFYIISLHSTKGSLYYAEVYKQVLENVLLEELPNGEKKYFNKQIGAVRFIPPKETLLESQFKTTNLLL